MFENATQIWRLVIIAGVLTQVARAENWPVWRGPRGDGTSLETNVPVHWSATSNVVWKTALPGIGHASPIVWSNHLFTVSALTDKQDRLLLCCDRASGKILWQRTVVRPPLEPKHKLNSYASSTPATDGQLVYATFLDASEMVVAAYDFNGNRRWLVRPGTFASKHGFCSSPILFKDKVIVNGDHDGDSYLVALARTDGKTLWKVPRENKTRSYCAPIIRDLAGRTQMILSGDKCVASYDPNDGTRHWVIDGPTEQFVASIVYNPKADMLFVTGGFPQLHILGVRPDGRGNITQTHVVWRSNKGVSYVPSPLSLGDWFFIVSDTGVASCFEAGSGKILWQERLGDGHHASLVSANGLVYFLSDEGVMTIVRAGPEFKVVARNEIGEKCSASPAVSEEQMFLRSDAHLYCIGTGKPQGR